MKNIREPFSDDRLEAEDEKHIAKSLTSGLPQALSEVSPILPKPLHCPV